MTTLQLVMTVAGVIFAACGFMDMIDRIEGKR